jgi:hypothetical protein
MDELWVRCVYRSNKDCSQRSLRRSERPNLVLAREVEEVGVLALLP